MIDKTSFQNYKILLYCEKHKETKECNKKGFGINGENYFCNLE